MCVCMYVCMYVYMYVRKREKGCPSIRVRRRLLYPSGLIEITKVDKLRNRRRPFFVRKWSSWKFRAAYLCEKEKIRKVGLSVSWNQTFVLRLLISGLAPFSSVVAFHLWTRSSALCREGHKNRNELPRSNTVLSRVGAPVDALPDIPQVT